mmetsp:Transcript_10969/g.16125  ORF Transcript_10969/g.16125 Transcript_10969/m.16125 type:complete len:324 (+) Transcript_10969:46-1017(+)
MQTLIKIGISGMMMIYTGKLLKRKMIQMYNQDYVEDSLLEEDLNGKTYIVSGATSGIGKEVMKQLIKQGGHVIMASRNKKKAEACIKEIKSMNEQATIDYQYVNLENHTSIYQFATKIKERGITINSLIHCAGMKSNKKGKRAKNGTEIHWHVNFLGTIAMTMALKEHILKDHTKVIVVGTETHEKAYHHYISKNIGEVDEEEKVEDKKYIQSKIALAYMTKALARRFKKIKPTWKGSLMVAYPGRAETHLNREKPWYQYTYGTKSAWQAAQTILYSVLSKNSQNGGSYEHATEKIEPPYFNIVEEAYIVSETLRQLQIVDPF